MTRSPLCVRFAQNGFGADPINMIDADGLMPGLVKAVGKAIAAGAMAVVNNPASLAAVAGVICFVPVLGAECVAATAVAVGASVINALKPAIVNDDYGASFGSLLLTAATAGPAAGFGYVIKKKAQMSKAFERAWSFSLSVFAGIPSLLQDANDKDRDGDGVPDFKDPFPDDCLL